MTYCIPGFIVNSRSESNDNSDIEMESTIQSQHSNTDPLEEMNLHQLVHLALILNLNIEDSSNNASWLKNLCRTEMNRTMKGDQEFIDVLFKSLKTKYPENSIDQRYQKIIGMPFINGSLKRTEDTQTCCISSLMNALLNVSAIKEIVLNHQDYGDCPILICLANYLLKPKHEKRTVVDLLKILKKETDANKIKNVEIEAQNKEIRQKNLEISDVSKKFPIVPLQPARYMFQAGRQEDPTEILSTLLDHCQPLRQVMMFKQRTMYTCSNCKHISWSPMEGDEANRRMMMLDMDDNINDFEQLLQKSKGGLEKMKKDCDYCFKKNLDHVKMVVFYQAPKVLAISLKRWNHKEPIRSMDDGSIIGYEKFTTAINLPNTIKFAGQDCMAISAVTHHSEFSEEGHYTAQIFEKFDENNQSLWTITDDMSISPSVRGDPDQAYMYFFSEGILAQQAVDNSTQYSKQSDDLESPSGQCPGNRLDHMEVAASQSVPTTSKTKTTSTTTPKSKTTSTPSNKKNSTQGSSTEAVPIDSEHDEEATIKARIVITNIGNLKIQCLECMKVFGKNIINHAGLSACKSAFNNTDTCDQLNILIDTLHYLQCQQTQKKSCEKRKQLKEKSEESSSTVYAKKSTKSKVANQANKSFKKSNPLQPNKQKMKNSNDLYWSQEDNKIRQKFRKTEREGLSYPCISCHRLLFKSGVTPYNIENLKDEVVMGIKNHKMEYCVSTDDLFKCDNKLWLCHNCNYNLKDGKMPNMCHANGLAISKLPEALRDLNQIELMLIKKKLVFIKVRELKPSRMLEMNNRLVNVPISDTDLYKTCSLLPRMENESGTVNVAFKRIRKSPYYYRKPELIRPKKVNDALEYLQKFHPSYDPSEMDIKKLNDANTYKFANLPLIGQLLEDEENLPTLEDCFNYLGKNDLLSKWLCPLGEKTEENYGKLMTKLLRQHPPQPQGKDCFLNGLKDQMR